MRDLTPVSPNAYVRRFFFHAITFGADYVKLLIGAYESDGLMARADGPTPIGQRGLGP